MLSGEDNENGEKTTIGLISKKTTLHVQHTFLVHFFAVNLVPRALFPGFSPTPKPEKRPLGTRLLCRCFERPQRKTSKNFPVTRFTEYMSYLLLFTFFHSLIFTLVTARISYFLTAAKKFSCCSSNK